jgi:outer membrane lipoprotein-sorting protein
LILLTLTVIAGCVPSKPAAEKKVLPADRLIKKLEANRRKIKTFKATGVINIKSPEVEAKGNFEVILKKPDSINVSIFGPFGVDLAQILVTKNNFVFYDVIHNDAYTGKNKQGILKKIFKIDIEFDDLMDAFAGAVNLTDKLRMEPDKYNVKDDGYILTYTDSLSGKESIYSVENNNLAITNYVLQSLTGDIIFEGIYSDFKNFEDVPIPYKSRVQNRALDQSVQIEYRNIEVNPEINDVSITIPNDVNIINW